MHFDIIIIGGGMVGATMASALSKLSYRIAMVDAATFPTNEKDHRFIALSDPSIHLFKNIDVWKSIEPHATPIQKIHVSQRKHFGVTTLLASDLNLDSLGYVIPAHFINSALYESLKDISLLNASTLTHLTEEKDKIQITVKTPEGDKTFTTGLLIGADGSHSTVRSLLNIATSTFDYEQSALVTLTHLHRSHHHIAYERFQENGAIAMLPLREKEVATIWTDQHSTIQELMKLDDDAFLKKLQSDFGYRLGRFIKISKRYTYPLKRIESTHSIKNNIILIGNAAHTLHPIAAQGFNLALYEIASLFEHLEKNGLSLENFANFQKSFSAQLSHHLNKIFSNNFLMVNIARSLALLSLDVFQFTKKYFMQKLLNQTHPIPRLLMDKTLHEPIHSRH